MTGPQDQKRRRFIRNAGETAETIVDAIGGIDLDV
jgi:hypothetical protein